MCRFRFGIFAIALLSIAGGARAADLPSRSCVRPAANARIVWTGTASGAVRVYFHSDLAKTEHYIEMMPGGAGRFWTILPKPTEEDSEIDYRIATVDAQGVTTRQQGRLAVINTCPATALSVEESKFAASLVIGSDVEGPAMPVGFRCDGIVGRISANELQAYNACSEKTLALAAAPRALVVVPPAQKIVTNKTSTSTSLQTSLLRIGTNGLAIVPEHHRTPRRAPLPPTPPQPRLTEPLSPSRP